MTKGIRLFMYGPPKCGLTSFAKNFCELNKDLLEEAQKNAQVISFNTCLEENAINSLDNLKELIKIIKKTEIPTLYFFDGLDGLEDIIARDVAQRLEVPHINAKEYAVGFFEATVCFKNILLALEKLVKQGHSFVFLGHSIEIPTKTSFLLDIMKSIPFCSLKNHKGEDVATLLTNWCDGLLFMRSEDQLDSMTRREMIYPYGTSFWLAGNRLLMNRSFEREEFYQILCNFI